MADTPLTLAVSTGREDRPVTGGDATTFPMPDGFYVDIGGFGPALVVQRFSRFLRELAEDQAATLGETLHHADFWVTNDPELVRAKGMMHDCPTCQDGMARTMAAMATDPGKDWVVGQLFWAG